MGSAANALIDRVPKGISWFSGRSKCDHCHHELSWSDLIPLVSFVFLSGKCRYCKKKISIRNFLVELIMAVSFALLYTTPLLLPLVFITLVIAVMDWETELVSEVLVLVWLVFVILAVGLSLNTFWGVLIGVGIIGGLWAVTRGRGMGFGDVEVVAVMGVWLPWPKMIIALQLAFIFGAVVGVTQIILKKNKLRGQIAFGTFLMLGAWAAYFWGDTIMKYYGL